jgi:hypothetical protein
MEGEKSMMNNTRGIKGFGGRKEANKEGQMEAEGDGILDEVDISFKSGKVSKS